MAYDILYAKLRALDNPINENLWQEIQTNSTVIDIKKNKVLIDVGSRHKYGYFVVLGSFVSSIVTEKGDKKAVWFYFDELFNLITAMDSYFLDEPTKYEVKSLEDSTLIRFNKQHVDLWVLKYPFFSQMYLTDITNNLTALNEIRAHKLSQSPTQFLEYINQNYPVIIRRVSSKNMAHFLGVSPEWYSKLKKKMGFDFSR
ncbi:MAG: hypothetical protein AAF849_15815 [Bacteroidota bacterium]